MSPTGPAFVLFSASPLSTLPLFPPSPSFPSLLTPSPRLWLCLGYGCGLSSLHPHGGLSCDTSAVFPLSLLCPIVSPSQQAWLSWLPQPLSFPGFWNHPFPPFRLTSSLSAGFYFVCPWTSPAQPLFLLLICWGSAWWRRVPRISPGTFSASKGSSVSGYKPSPELHTCASNCPLGCPLGISEFRCANWSALPLSVHLLLPQISPAASPPDRAPLPPACSS